MSSASLIFRPYRGLGLVSSDIPFVVKYKPHSREYNILVPVGERFNVYQVCACPTYRKIAILLIYSFSVTAVAESQTRGDKRLFACRYNFIY